MKENAFVLWVSKAYGDVVAGEVRDRLQANVPPADYFQVLHEANCKVLSADIQGIGSMARQPCSATFIAASMDEDVDARDLEDLESL